MQILLLHSCRGQLDPEEEEEEEDLHLEPANKTVQM